MRDADCAPSFRQLQRIGQLQKMLSCPIIFDVSNSRQDAADYINVLNSRVMDGSRRRHANIQALGDIECELTQRRRDFKSMVKNTIVEDPMYDPENNFYAY